MLIDPLHKFFFANIFRHRPVANRFLICPGHPRFDFNLAINIALRKICSKRPISQISITKKIRSPPTFTVRCDLPRRRDLHKGIFISISGSKTKTTSWRRMIRPARAGTAQRQVHERVVRHVQKHTHTHPKIKDYTKHESSLYLIK